MAQGNNTTNFTSVDAKNGFYVNGVLVMNSTSVPSQVIKFAGEVTWTGGLITLAETVTGALATDIVIANFQTIGTEGTTVASAVTADTVTFTLDTANTSNDAVISYQVIRTLA